MVCFLSAARTGSFSAAARELNTTQQAVSRYIDNLEQELGVQLFLRVGWAVRPTKAGLKYLELFQHLSQELDDAGRLYRNIGPTLRVGWSSWTGCPETVHQCLQSFDEAHPRFQLEVCQADADDLAKLLQDGELDALVCSRFLTHQLPPQCVCTPLMELPVFSAAAAGTPDPAPENLPHLTACIGQEEPEAAVERVRGEYDRLGLPRRPVEVLPNAASVYAEVAIGGGITFTPVCDFLRGTTAIDLHPLRRQVTLSFVFLQSNTNRYLHALQAHLLAKLEVSL